MVVFCMFIAGYSRYAAYARYEAYVFEDWSTGWIKGETEIKNHIQHKKDSNQGIICPVVLIMGPKIKRIE